VFYEDPLPHVSFAWALGDERGRMAAALRQAGGEEWQRRVPFELGSVLCRVGQRDYVVWPPGA
jgi:hypothetical protein